MCIKLAFFALCLMKKLLNTFFLYFGVFLLSGSSLQNAYTTQDYTNLSSIKTLEETEDISIDQDALTLSIKHLPSDTKKAKNEPDFSVVENKEEDDKSNSLEKLSENGHYFTKISSAFIIGKLYLNNKNFLPSSKHFNFSTSYKLYILLQVFRI